MKQLICLLTFITTLSLSVSAQLSIEDCQSKGFKEIKEVKEVRGLAQLTIGDCQIRVRENYPLIKKYNWIEQSKEYTLANVTKGYLPQFQINARASYQSEVTSIPLSLPGIAIPKIKKDQYQASVEANQLLWDGGMIRAQRGVVEAGSEVEIKQTEVDVYALEERVNQLFFGILLFDAQLEQNRILQEELSRNYTTVSNYMKNGVANQADIDAVKVEQLNAKQAYTQLQSARTAYVEMLSRMLGETLEKQTIFIRPSAELLPSPAINRPELRLFEAQNQLFDSQKEGIKSTYMPKLGLFVQGGYGRPGLNMLATEFEPFYIGGIRLSWNFGSLYTQKNDLRKIEVNKQLVNTQKEVFLYNIQLAVTQENREIKRLKDLMQYDEEIITLRENIRKSTEAKVANGTSTVTDLMREISREDLARQAKASHEIDLLIAIYKLKNTTNN
jgi:outer membrane protein TolC